jgi:enoyl-CoA hydratase/carnithine racemase
MSDVTYGVTDGIATVAFNRPDRRNALRSRTYAELLDKISAFNRDPNATVLILTGSGSSFCAGQDLDEAEDLKYLSPSDMREKLQVVQNVTRQLAGSGKPTLAAINGPAVGAGAEIPLACDLRVASRSAFFQFPELELGMFMTNGSSELLAATIGVGRALDMILLGERLTAAEALAAGLVSRVVSDSRLLDTVKEMASKLSTLDSRAVSLAKSAVRRGTFADLDRALDLETEATLQLLRRSGETTRPSPRLREQRAQAPRSRRRS